MSYYSASMRWDHTRLTSSKVVARITYRSGTARSVVYRYYRYSYRYRCVRAMRLTAQCFGLSSTRSYLAIVSLVPVFLGDGMPAVDRADLKRRRRLASRVLVSGSRGGETAKRKHLVDGVWLERLPFNANGTFPPNTPGPRRTSLSASGPRVDEDILFAESAQPVPEPESCCAWLLQRSPRSIRVRFDATLELI